ARDGVEVVADPARLVARGDDDVAAWRPARLLLSGHGRVFCRPQPWEEKLADIEAHITGTVWKIEVAVGDSVEDGDTVVILESMKMEMPVEAEDSGTVSEIRCEEGQSVSEGDVLVVLD